METLARVWLLILVYVSYDFLVALHISFQKHEWVTDELLGNPQNALSSASGSRSSSWSFAYTLGFEAVPMQPEQQ